jgi:hypothetical protein
MSIEITPVSSTRSPAITPPSASSTDAEVASRGLAILTATRTVGNDGEEMTLSEKLQIKAGQAVALVGVPSSVTLDLDRTPTTEDLRGADAVIAFVVSAVEIDTVAEPVIAAAQEDRLAWLAYPKAGQLGTDLNRDRLRTAVAAHGVQPVRQISLDEVWSALRLRPA